MYHDHATKGKILFDNYENIVGQNGYLHELIKVNNNVNTFKIQYEDEFSIADIYIYNDNKLEGVVIDRKQLNYILADLNFNGVDSQFFENDREDTSVEGICNNKICIIESTKPCFYRRLYTLP